MKTAKNRSPRIAALVLFISLLLPCSFLFAEITITDDAQFQFALETMKKGDYQLMLVLLVEVVILNLHLKMKLGIKDILK